MIIKKTDLKKTPWKNGRGMTEVIAEWAGEHLLWKLSVATLTESAPFSEYPGYNRFLTVIEGQELLLKFESKCETGTTSNYSLLQGKTAHFSGDKATQGEIPKGPVKDLGLIYLRDQVQADFQIFEIGKKPKSFSLNGTTCFVFVQSGAVSVSLYPGEKTYKLKSGDTLRMDSSDPKKAEEKLFLLEASGSDSVRVVLIEISTS